MALLRPFTAILSVISAGLLVGVTDSGEQQLAVDIGCGAGGCVSAECCSQDEIKQSRGMAEAIWTRTLEGLRYAFSDLIDDLSLWLLVGIIAAGCVVTIAPPNMLQEWG